MGAPGRCGRLHCGGACPGASGAARHGEPARELWGPRPGSVCAVWHAGAVVCSASGEHQASVTMRNGQDARARACAQDTVLATCLRRLVAAPAWGCRASAGCRFNCFRPLYNAWLQYMHLFLAMQLKPSSNLQLQLANCEALTFCLAFLPCVMHALLLRLLSACATVCVFQSLTCPVHLAASLN